MNSDKFCSLILTETEFGDSLYEEISNIVRVLLKAGYVCVIDEEDTGIIKIDYNYSFYKHFGNPIPAWLTEDEIYSYFYAGESDKD